MCKYIIGKLSNSSHPWTILDNIIFSIISNIITFFKLWRSKMSQNFQPMKCLDLYASCNDMKYHLMNPDYTFVLTSSISTMHSAKKYWYMVKHRAIRYYVKVQNVTNFLTNEMAWHIHELNFHSSIATMPNPKNIDSWLNTKLWYIVWRFKRSQNFQPMKWLGSYMSHNYTKYHLVWTLSLSLF